MTSFRERFAACISSRSAEAFEAGFGLGRERVRIRVRITFSEHVSARSLGFGGGVSDSFVVTSV